MSLYIYVFVCGLIFKQSVSLQNNSGIQSGHGMHTYRVAATEDNTAAKYHSKMERKEVVDKMGM